MQKSGLPLAIIVFKLKSILFTAQTYKHCVPWKAFQVVTTKVEKLKNLSGKKKKAKGKPKLRDPSP